MGERGRGWARSQIIRPQESLVLYEQTILSVVDPQEGNKIGDLGTALVKKENQIFPQSCNARSTLQRRSDLCIPRNETVSSFHIHVSVSDLYIPRIGLPICCSKVGRPILGIYKSLTDI
jgi:hypothetical protein